MTWGVARLGIAAERRAHTAAVADLVALAAVTGGDEGARAVAAANGASVRSISRVGTTVSVEVATEGVVDVAAARPGVGDGG